MIDFPSTVRVQSEQTLSGLAGDVKPNYRVVQVESGRFWLSAVGAPARKGSTYKLIVSTVPFDSASTLALGTFDPIPVLASETITPPRKNSRTFEVSINPSRPVAFSFGFFPGFLPSEFLISTTLLIDGQQSGQTTVKRVKVFPVMRPEKVRVKQVPVPRGTGYVPIVRTFDGTGGGALAPTTVSGTVSVMKKLVSTDKMAVSFKLSNGQTIYSGTATYSSTAASLYIYSFKIPVSASRGNYNTSGTVRIVSQSGLTIDSTPLPPSVTIQ